MNLYFLVEGQETEPKIYPKWLSYLLPQMTRVNFANMVTHNHYFLMSGMGSPRILYEELPNAISEINELGNFDFLILVIDADDMSEQEKIAEVSEHMSDYTLQLNVSCQLKIIVQKYCIETWFLGNKKVFTRNPALGDFSAYADFYDVAYNDPELMIKPSSFNRSTAVYHEHYLKKMLAEKNIRYSKSNPSEMAKEYYFNELKKRVTETQHLTSLKNSLQFFEYLQTEANF